MMPSRKLPTYKYRPSASTAEPNLRTVSSLRARLFAGGTYFRSREPGLLQNNISVEVIELQEPTSLTTGLGFCVITNHNVLTSEMIQPNLQAPILTMSGATYANLWEVVRGDPDDAVEPPHALRSYTISVEISFARQSNPSVTLPAPTSSVPFEFDRFVKAGKLSIKLKENAPPGASGSSIFIAPRTRIYQLSVAEILPAPDDPGGAITYGWDIADLRTKVNADNPWVEMLPRSGPTDDGLSGPLIPNPNPADVQDKGTDAKKLSPFSQQFLEGGDGLPATPSSEITGPFRSLIHVNYGEAHNGELKEINTVYEWVGDSAIEGSWVAY